MEHLRWVLLKTVEEFLRIPKFNFRKICTAEFIKEKDLHRRTTI